jgi:hypothetical protein
MGGKCSNIKQKRTPTEIFSENLKVRVYFRELEVDGRMKLKFNLEKYYWNFS